jgi:hypothetical protein
MGVLVVNSLANLLPINGLNTGEVSALYPSLFTPAGITFSIWSVIYLLLIGFVVMLWVRKKPPITQSVINLFWISCLLNGTWIVAWHYLFAGVSVLVMLLLLGTLGRIFLINRNTDFDSIADTLFIRLPFTLYFAWICVALIANVAAFLISMEWKGGLLSEGTWTVLMMGTATILSLWMMLRYHAEFFCAVVMWALFGIFVRWNGTTHQNIANAAMAFIIVNGILILYSLRKQLLRYVGFTEG